MSIWDRKKLSFGFVSTRFAGTDGVSLETKKWVDVLCEKGCDVYYMAGELDTEPSISQLAPKASFQHPDILDIQRALFEEKRRTRSVTQTVNAIKEGLRDALDDFHKRFDFDILVVQNALAIPVNVPLGLALTEFISETRIPTIAHHHDFYWERQRFHSFAAMDYLRTAFPPVHNTIQHVVINSLAGSEFAQRTGESWTLVPNIMDFKTLPPTIQEHNADLREQIGLSRDAFLVLQPTRVVSRKGIETAIELVRRLQRPKSVLVIPHEAGDEGLGYQKRVEEYAEFLGVDIRFISERIAKERGVGEDKRKRFTLSDVYPHADLVTYPSLYEGYGNAFVEAVYFRKPLVVNRYRIFESDIEPLGFKVVSFNGYITDETIAELKALFADPAQLAETAEHNYLLGWRYLSYEMLEEKLESLLTNIYGS